MPCKSKVNKPRAHKPANTHKPILHAARLQKRTAAAFLSDFHICQDKTSGRRSLGSSGNKTHSLQFITTDKVKTKGSREGGTSNTTGLNYLMKDKEPKVDVKLLLCLFIMNR